MATEHGLCRVRFPFIMEYISEQGLSMFPERFRCSRKRKHTGMHQARPDNDGKRVEWTGGTR